MDRMKSRSEVLRVARAQRLLVWAIFATIFLMAMLVGIQIVLALVQEGVISPATARIMVACLQPMPFLVLAFQIFGVVNMGLALRYGWWSAGFVLMLCVPCVSFFALLVLNDKATSLLQECGIQVGLMGARQADLDRYHPSRITCPVCGEQLDAGESLCRL